MLGESARSKSKNKCLKVLVFILLLSLILDSGYVPKSVYAKTSQQELNDAESEYEETSQKKDSASKELNRLRSDRDSLMSDVDTLNGKLEDAALILENLEENISNTQARIDAAWGYIEELSAAIDDLQNQARVQYIKVKDQIKFIYESGDDLSGIFLAGSGSYSEYINRSVYLQMFTKYYQDSIDELVETGERLAETKEEYEKNLIKLEELRTDLEEYQATVSKQYEAIQSDIDEASKKVKEKQDQIEVTETNIEKYEEELAHRENDIEDLKKKIEEEKKISETAAVSTWRDISNVSVPASERKLLANLIWCEAGNEPYTGQVAVGAVVMNRVMSSVFPDTITGVIYQSGQFTPARSGKLSLALSRDSATESCYQAADAAISGVNNVGSSLYFRTPTSSVTPKYVIGGHIFY